MSIMILLVQPRARREKKPLRAERVGSGVGIRSWSSVLLAVGGEAHAGWNKLSRKFVFAYVKIFSFSLTKPSDSYSVALTPKEQRTESMLGHRLAPPTHIDDKRRTAMLPRWQGLVGSLSLSRVERGELAPRTGVTLSNVFI